ncbi:MAG: universal stress protein [Dehalococcoidales bacterium]
MYQKIMVPLDGSKLAEVVLPHVEAIAKGCSVSNVILVRVVEPVMRPTGEDYFPLEEDRKLFKFDRKAAAKDYLNQLVSRLKYDGVNIQAKVIVGKAAESLIEYAEKNGVDFIAIATHGRSGVSRWVRGSVAERILHSACVPVLVVRPPECKPSI